ncbi:YqcI/YcgG family protein [Halobacillus sp. KGW1]|uniref:YqcI/YcgG family protein n=1 Tax=Halobacillus sp. KGW1 TaxID=1793726 RepID=UPI000782DCC9|nr:YqcI/YcgG family protein [Halobacillus sp. KGW1]
MLYRKTELENAPERTTWQSKAFTSFSELMLSRESPYPCVPGIQGFKADMLRFAFLSDPSGSAAPETLGQILKQYGTISRETGDYASLVVLCEPCLHSYQIKDYESLFWNLLNECHAADEREWPEHIPLDPSDPAWEFCYDGEPYFAFCATPAHERRKSRHFPYLLLAFQPRFVFEKINASTPLGRKLQNVIRKRLSIYDDLPIHPSLKWYGEENNHEWKQYFLAEENTSPSKCPFMAMKQKWNSLRS